MLSQNCRLKGDVKHLVWDSMAAFANDRSLVDSQWALWIKLVSILGFKTESLVYVILS